LVTKKTMGKNDLKKATRSKVKKTWEGCARHQGPLGSVGGSGTVEDIRKGFRKRNIVRQYKMGLAGKRVGTHPMLKKRKTRAPVQISSARGKIQSPDAETEFSRYKGQRGHEIKE